MIDWMNKGHRRMAFIAIAMLVLAVSVELVHRLSAKPVALPLLLFELFEVLLLVGCGISCTLLIMRVRVSEMVAATTAMVLVLLGGEIYFADGLATLPILLEELIEVALMVGATIAGTLLLGSLRKTQSKS